MKNGHIFTNLLNIEILQLNLNEFNDKFTVSDLIQFHLIIRCKKTSIIFFCKKF